MRAERNAERARLGALLEAFLLVDFFGGAPLRRAGSALATAATFQAVLGVIVGALLYLSLSPFALLVSGLTYVAVITALALGPEAGEILRAANDEALGGLPFRRGTARAARALHVAVYLVLGTSGAAIPIAVFAGAAAGSVALGVAAYLAALHQSAFFAALTVGIESALARSAAGSRLRPAVSFLVGAGLVGALLVGVRPLPELERFIADAAPWLAAFPPAWFAAEALAASGLGAAAHEGLWITALAATALSAALAAWATSRPARADDRAIAPPSALRRAFARLFVRERERATFDFTLNVLGRERERALRAGPIFAFPAALLVAGAALRDPEERRLFVHVALFVASAYLPAAVVLLARSRDAAARWMFETAPIDRPRALRAGVRKATAFRVVLPMIAALVAADVAVRGPAVAALHAPLVLGVALLVLHRAVAGLPDPFPFSEEMGRFAGGVGENAIGLAFVLTGVGFLELWCVRDAISSAVATLGLAALLVALDRRSR